MTLPVSVEQPAPYRFVSGDRVTRVYPMRVAALIGQHPNETAGIVVSVSSVTGYVSVDWDNGQKSLVNPAYLQPTNK